MNDQPFEPLIMDTLHPSNSETDLLAAWQWNRHELLAGNWLCAFCTACNGTGLTDQHGRNTTCPWCKNQVTLAYYTSGGIRYWNRYESADLTTFDWRRIGAQATDTVQSYADSMEEMIANGRGLVISGGTGAGKTHLAISLGIIALGMGYEVYATLLGDVLLTIRATWSETHHSHSDESRLLDKLCTIKLLILDDLGSEKPTGWAKERLAHIINRRYTARLPTIVTTNLELSDLETLWSSRVTSRLLGTAQVVELHDVKDYRR